MFESKYNFYDVIERFREHNRDHGYHYGCTSAREGVEITAIIVYEQSNFTKQYSEKERSYRVSNFGGKAFYDGMISNSIYGDCLDGIDLGVRLDAYNWKIERVYFENELSKKEEIS